MLSPAPTVAAITQPNSGVLTAPWLLWFSALFQTVKSVGTSGPTANRPVNSSQSPLLVGQVYFDTTLGKPVFCQTVAVPAVWVDATGAPV
jgi:hypothetical protein